MTENTGLFPHSVIFDRAPKLEELKRLPAEVKGRLLLARLERIGATDSSALNKHNLMMPGDPYQLAYGYSADEKDAVRQHLMGAPWTRLVNQGYLADYHGQGFHSVTDEGKQFLEAEEIAVEGPQSETALAAFGQRARKAFELKVGNLYQRSIQEVHDLKDQYSNEGVASAGKYLRKTADLLVNDFHGLEPVLNETYLRPFSGKSILKTDESWLRREIDYVVDVETTRIKNMFDSLAPSFVGTTPDSSVPYLAQFDQLALLLKRRLGISLELAVSEEGESGNRSSSAAASPEADLDILMSIPSRKEYEKRLPGLFAAASAHSPLSLLMLDLDHFKQFNDNYGHATGDKVLTMAAESIRTVVGDKGTPFRYGGEEIVALLPNHNAEEASAVASRIRGAIEAMTIPGLDSPVTVSIGVSTFPDIATDVNQLFQLADAALYRSKEEGRNRVSMAIRAGAKGPTKLTTKSLKQDDFQEHKLGEARALLSKVSWVERDFIRLLLLRGTCTNHLAAKLAKVAESEVMSAFTNLPQRGLVERVEDFNQSVVTFSVSGHWLETFKLVLFPRDEGDKPDAFGT